MTRLYRIDNQRGTTVMRALLLIATMALCALPIAVALAQYRP
jgi:hypothetical protein